MNQPVGEPPMRRIGEIAEGTGFTVRTLVDPAAEQAAMLVETAPVAYAVEQPTTVGEFEAWLTQMFENVTSGETTVGGAAATWYRTELRPELSAPCGDFSTDDKCTIMSTHGIWRMVSSSGSGGETIVVEPARLQVSISQRAEEPLGAGLAVAAPLLDSLQIDVISVGG